MIRLANEKGIPIRFLYQKIFVIYMAVLIVGNTFQLEPPYYIILIVSILTVFFSSKNISQTYVRQYLFIISFAFYGIIVALITEGGFGGALTIVTGLMVLYASQQIKFDKYDIAILAIVMLISIAYWVYKSPTYYSEFFYNQWKGDNTYTNSNGVGHYLAYEGSFLFMILSLGTKRWMKWAKWGLVIICLWGCYNVRARMALATLFLFIFVNLIAKNKKHRKGIVKSFLIFSIILEIIFPFIYLLLYKSGIGNNIKFFGLAEKGLYSGREQIWKSTFDTMNTLPSIMFGIGSKHDFWKDGLLNMHNNAMNLLVVVGVLGLIVYFVYLVIYINKKFDFINASEIQWQCLIFFICIMVEGTTDITIFYNPFLTFYFVPLGIALNKNYTMNDI